MIISFKYLSTALPLTKSIFDDKFAKIDKYYYYT